MWAVSPWRPEGVMAGARYLPGRVRAGCASAAYPFSACLEREMLGFPSGEAIKVKLHSEEKSFRGAVPHRRHNFTCSVKGIAPGKSAQASVPSAGRAACHPGEPRALLMPEAFKLIFRGVSHSWMGHCLEKTAIMQPFIYLLRESLK